MKYIKLSILIPFVVMLIIWVTGRMSISKDERKRIKETQFKAFPLFEPIGVTDEIQEFTFKIKPHRTSSRYSINLYFAQVGDEDRKRILYPFDEVFSKEFSLSIENARTGQVLFRHANLEAFRYQNVGAHEMLWNIKTKLRFRWGSEYLVHVTMPGIEDAPDELSEIYLRCHIPFLPSL